jgi:hypothetical protein
VHLRRSWLAVLAVLAFAVFVAAAPPPAPRTAPIVSLIDAPTPGSPGGNLLADLGPLLVIALAVAIAVVVGAGFILFRTRASATPAPTPEDWWTCANCSAGNLEGTARCHACGSWRSANARPTPSATR